MGLLNRIRAQTPAAGPSLLRRARALRVAGSVTPPRPAVSAPEPTGLETPETPETPIAGPYTEKKKPSQLSFRRVA